MSAPIILDEVAKLLALLTHILPIAKAHASGYPGVSLKSRQKAVAEAEVIAENLRNIIYKTMDDRDALLKFVSHKRDCASQPQRWGMKSSACNCGLSEIVPMIMSIM